MAIIRLCQIFKQLCAKVVDLATIRQLKNEVVMTLVLLEQKFPPFFDIMTHLLVYLVEELELCGPIPTQWMYHVEQYKKTLKGYVGGLYNHKTSSVDDKEDPSMFDEVLEGGGHPRILIIDL